MADSQSSQLPEDELTVPRAPLNKMIKELLPNVRVANDARELILNCCTEFIQLVSSEANDICNKQAKKTISPEHALQALDSLGFGDYLQECKSVLEECKTVAAKKRKASTRLENLGIPEEELLRQQQELFEKARQEQAAIEHQEWLQLQAAQAAQAQQQGLQPGMQPGMQPVAATGGNLQSYQVAEGIPQHGAVPSLNLPSSGAGQLPTESASNQQIPPS
ncbi:protein Dr1-like [Lytechinus pictus]|uniref:protein Dr1-like n=1 Tax=Lytechinus pictus TaxID=7653 RepID=UPI00240D9913|nr:protein Dr1-like [Lytechinus pictus]